MNIIDHLQNFVDLKDQLEVCLTCSRLLTGIPINANGIPKFKVINDKITLNVTLAPPYMYTLNREHASMVTKLWICCFSQLPCSNRDRLEIRKPLNQEWSVKPN